MAWEYVGRFRQGKPLDRYDSQRLYGMPSYIAKLIRFFHSENELYTVALGSDQSQLSTFSSTTLYLHVPKLLSKPPSG